MFPFYHKENYASDSLFSKVYKEMFYEGEMIFKRLEFAKSQNHLLEEQLHKLIQKDYYTRHGIVNIHIVLIPKCRRKVFSERKRVEMVKNSKNYVYKRELK